MLRKALLVQSSNLLQINVASGAKSVNLSVEVIRNTYSTYSFLPPNMAANRVLTHAPFHVEQVCMYVFMHIMCILVCTVLTHACKMYKV